MSHTSTLAEKLVDDAYGPLFTYPQRDQTVEKIWAEPDNPAALEALIDAPEAPVKARFAAAEVLFARDFTFVSRHDASAIARLYAAALQGKLTGHANAWGLLWANDTPGEVGGRFIALGKDAIPALRDLLDDRAVVDWYVGSETATVGNGAKYRIRDFAAFYLSRILRMPIPFHADVAARDAEIAKLVAALPAPDARR